MRLMIAVEGEEDKAFDDFLSRTMRSKCTEFA
jgi:hypothetical protein